MYLKKDNVGVHKQFGCSRLPHPDNIGIRNGFKVFGYGVLDLNYDL